MANFPELDQLAQTFLQVVALLFPVTYVTMRWILDREASYLTEKQVNYISWGFIVLIILLTVVGLTATIGVLDISGVKQLSLFTATMALAVYFSIYGSIFVSLIVWSGER
jgi:uncharacterized membrane protein